MICLSDWGVIEPPTQGFSIPLHRLLMADLGHWSHFELDRVSGLFDLNRDRYELGAAQSQAASRQTTA